MRNATRSLVLLLALMLIASGSAMAEVIRGKVTNVDLQANRVSLQAEGKDRSFTFDPEDFIVWQGDDEVKPDAIKAGVEAEVGYYTDEKGLEIASWVDLTPIEEGEEIVTVPNVESPLPQEVEPAAAPMGTQEHPGKEHPGTEVPATE